MRFLRGLKENWERVTAVGARSDPVSLFSSLNRWMNSTQISFAFGRHAEDGQAYRWRITTPLRLFYGGSDEVVAERR